jgi:hypothetical protein
MDKLKYWFRWISVFPGALIAGLLIIFPLHWLLYLKFAHSGTFLGFIEFPARSNISIEYVIYPFIIAITYIFAGYKIAPKYKFKTAIVLFVIYLAIWLIVSVISLFANDTYGLDMQFSWRTVLAVIGAVIGLYIAKKDSEEKN